MYNQNVIEFKSPNSEVSVDSVTFANYTSELTVDEQIDLRLAIATARDTAMSNSKIYSEDNYWDGRVKAYSNLLDKINELYSF